MLFQNENKCWSIENSHGTEFFFFFLIRSNNQQCNSMSSQSNRNWASTTPGKFLSSLLYLRSKPLVFLQALLNVRLLQNVWEGLRVSCTGLSVREQVPDSCSPTNNTLLGPSEALPPRAAAGSLCELPAVVYGSEPAVCTLSHGITHTYSGALLSHTQHKGCPGA